MRFLFKAITNPIIGPIVVASFTLLLLAIFYLPMISSDNEKNKIIKESSVLVDNLKAFRSYYNEFVVKKLKNKVDVVVDYNHEYSSNTIPLPATTIHNISEKLTQKNQSLHINFFSDYPFPHRAKRVLDDFQKESMDYFRTHKESNMYTKEDVIDNQSVFRVAFADYMVSQSCVDCHNNRIDTPKDDWKVGDVRGVIEVIKPFHHEFVLNSTQTKNILIFMFIVVLAFVTHYTILYFMKEKEAKQRTKLLEEEVKTRTKDLQDSNLLLLEHKKAVDASAIVSKADKKGNITYVNETFCEVSGYSRAELIGQPHNIVRHPDMPKEVFKELWETIKNKKIYKGMIKNKKKDGTAYYVASTIVPILDKQGELIEYLSLRYDITELVEAREKALMAEQAKSIFLANMSHEIRTPLNAIIGFSDILCEANIPHDEKEQVKIISKSAKSLLNIINDVLDISKMENGKLEIDKQRFSLYDLSENIVKLFSVNANDKTIKFIYTIDSKLPELVIGDATRLQQVLSNLLSNAIKFTPELGKVYFDVLVENIDTVSKKAKIKFSVKDTGIGMTQEQLELIFKPFSQADSGISRKFGGTGLGLAISSDIIKMMGSQIRVNSEENKGSEFYFELDFSIIDEKNSLLKKTDLKFAVCSLSNDENKIKKSVTSYLEKIGQILELENNSNAKADFFFCFEEVNKEALNNFKKSNPKVKIIFVGDKHLLDGNSSENIDYFIDLPIYGSKIYNIIADNSTLNFHAIKNSSSTESFNAKVLVAEDNPNNQQLIEILLKKLGIEVTLVSNGQDAIEAYKINHYDLILMDINMPILDGVSATKAIHLLQKESNYYAVPIIALTANSIAGDKEKYMLEGMDDYLSKPIEFEKLVALLKKFLNIKESPQTLLSSSNIAKALGVPDDVAVILIESFKEEILKDLEELKQAIESKDEKTIVHKAHYIKNSCLNMCLKDAVVLLQNIEHNAQQSTDELIDVYNQLHLNITKQCNLEQK